MNTLNLRDYLYEQIPLAQAMEVEIKEASPSQVILTAPLDPNSNHMDTAFGGSLSTILILACYAYLFNQLDSRGLHAHVIIKEGSTKYLAPVREELMAICPAPEVEKLNHFLKVFERKGRARMILSAYVGNGPDPKSTFSGEFVAVKA